MEPLASRKVLDSVRSRTRDGKAREASTENLINEDEKKTKSLIKRRSPTRNRV